MLTIKECRKILDTEADKLTDNEIIELRDWLSSLADIAIEESEKNSLQKKNDS